MDQDQLFHDLEQRYSLLKREHDSVCLDRDSYKGKFFIFLFESDSLISLEKNTNLQITVDTLRQSSIELEFKLSGANNEISKVNFIILFIKPFKC